MKTYKNLYNNLSHRENLFLACLKTRKGKTRKYYVKKFEENFVDNIKNLHEELKNQTYKPASLKKFIIRDPKTRIIHKSIFKDRIVHHAIINVLESIFEPIFIYDSYASRKNKGHHKALERFDYFKRIISKNNTRTCYVLKADIKHYFQEVDHEILLNILKRKIGDEKVIFLIEKILKNCANTEIQRERERETYNKV